MANGRDEFGRFIAGNTISKGQSPGRPKRSVEEKRMLRLYAVCTPAEWDKATRAILKKAQEGNVAAYKALASYYWGLPIQRSIVDVTTNASPITLTAAKDIIAARLALVDAVRVTVEIPTKRTPVEVQ